jgi:hypothetical protein
MLRIMPAINSPWVKTGQRFAMLRLNRLAKLNALSNDLLES